jgi:hypothetical protein
MPCAECEAILTGTPRRQRNKGSPGQGHGLRQLLEGERLGEQRPPEVRAVHVYHLVPRQRGALVDWGPVMATAFRCCPQELGPVLHCEVAAVLRPSQSCPNATWAPPSLDGNPVGAFWIFL